MEVCEQISPSVSFSFSCGSGLHGSWEAGIDTAHCVKAWKSHPYNPAHWWGHWTDGKVEPRCKTLQVAHVSARSCGSIVLIPYKYRCTHTIWTWLRFTWINATQSLKGLLNSESDFAAKKKLWSECWALPLAQSAAPNLIQKLAVLALFWLHINTRSLIKDKALIFY